MQTEPCLFDNRLPIVSTKWRDARDALIRRTPSDGGAAGERQDGLTIVLAMWAGMNCSDVNSRLLGGHPMVVSAALTFLIGEIPRVAVT